MDKRHALDAGLFPFPGNKPGVDAGHVEVWSQYVVPDWHHDVFSSKDGKFWAPERYHQDDGSGVFSTLAVPERRLAVPSFCRVEGGETPSAVNMSV